MGSAAAGGGRGLLDQVGYDLRLRDMDGVAGGDLADRGAGPVGHSPLAAGGIIWSSVVTRYQQGLARQVGWLTSPPRASTPHGTCESARNYARGMALSLDQALDLAVGEPIQRDHHRRNPVAV